MRQRGVTLVELMIALVLGLVVSGAALALFVTNRQTYVASENLDRIQESSRTAFELMARDLREADGNPCSNEIVLTNELANSATYAWWSNWGAGLRGYAGATAFPDDGFGTTVGKRKNGTDAVDLWTAVPTGSVIKTDMATVGSDLDVTATTGNISANDILVICDNAHGTIFQATGVATNKIEHHAGGTPGNIDGNLPPDIYKVNATVSHLHAERWYIGYNGRKDQDGNDLTSLYRTSVTGSAAAQTPDEIVPDVTDMQLQYHSPGGGGYVDTPGDWADVDAVKVQLTMAGRDKIGTDGNKLQRTFENVIAIRNRAQ